MINRIHNKYNIPRRLLYLLLAFCIVALFHNIIATDKYLICKTSDGIAFNVKSDKCDFGIKALIPYSSTMTDSKNRNVGPFDSQDVSSVYYRHWLGTDALGRDVLAGLIKGSNTAFLVGGISSLMALLIGVFLAYWSGYIGDDRFKIAGWTYYLFVFILTISFFYSIYLKSVLGWLIMLIPFICLALFRHYARTNVPEAKLKSIPFDLIIFRIIEIFKSIPGLFFLLILLALFKTPGYWNVILIIAFLRWPVITRHLRAEILKIKQENYITAAQAIGLSEFRIFKKYILPLTISPVIITTAFGFSTAILLESTLSFLGIGVPIDQVSWGSILREARFNFSSWWLAIFPGLLIYLSIYLFNAIGDRINDYLLSSKQ